MITEKNLKVSFVEINGIPGLGIVEVDDREYQNIWVGGSSFSLKEGDKLRVVGSGIVEGEEAKLSEISLHTQKYETVAENVVYIMAEYENMDALSFVELNDNLLMGYMAADKMRASRSKAVVYYFKASGLINSVKFYTSMSHMIMGSTGIIWEGKKIMSGPNRSIQHFMPEIQKNKHLYYSNEHTMQIEDVVVYGVNPMNGKISVYTIVNGERTFFPFETDLVNLHEEPNQAKKALKDTVNKYKADFLNDDLWIEMLYQAWGNSDNGVSKVQKVAMKKVITFKTGKRFKAATY